MEEVATPLAGVPSSELIGPEQTRADRYGRLSAPLDAPPERPFNQAEYHKVWRNGPGRERFVASVKRWQQRNPEKRRAHYDVDNAIRAGRLVKGPCEREGKDCKGRIEAHHDDYTKTLEVRWFCKRHHKQADRERKLHELARVAVSATSLFSLLAALACSLDGLFGIREWR